MPTGVKTSAEPLADELARRGSLPAAQALDIVRQLARQIAQWHESGRLHLQIDTTAVNWEPETGRAELREPSDAARSFGGTDCDDEFCPPEFQQARSVPLGTDLSAAREALRAAGWKDVDPRRIDVYQLATLLCRMLTGQSVNDFLSRPRVAAKVPPEVREVIERALGHDAQRAFRTATELLHALESLDASQTQALPNLAGSTRNDAKPDTTPSFVNVGKADTDVGRPAPSPRDDAALPFRKLGHYEIVGRLGRGGMGDVYKGYEPRLDRHVAIKVLPAEFSRQDEMVQRFYAEASAAAKLVHPNTVEIHFIGQDEVSVADGQAPSTLHFFAMRFVEGESLAELLVRRKKLSVDETLAIIEQALAGLSAAHRLGMVHRDIKPGNILIDRERQRVLLADFGLVKSLQAAASMTASGVIVGTVDYMAPEQGRGETVDARADLYAIGVVLYQMLSGRLPFKADSPTGLIFKHVYETPPPLRDVAPDVPRELAEIIAKLMSKSPDARYQNVEALLTDLRAFHQGHPLPSAASIAPTLDRPRTVIIPAPRFAEEAVLPATLTQIATPGRWQRTRQAIRDFLLVPREEFVRQLQTTETQVDDAIAEYERRHASLASAILDAEAVVQELETERETWRRAIADAEQRAADAPDDDSARSALGEKLRGERALSELSEQYQSQQAQLAEMGRKQSQVTATLERLRSQRDVLNARLKVARAQIRMSGGSDGSGGARDEFFARRVVQWVHRLRWQNVSLIALTMIILGVATSILAKMLLHTFPDLPAMTSSEPPTVEVNPNPAIENARSLADLYMSPPTVVSQPFSGCDKFVLDLAVSSTGTHVAATSGGPVVFVWDAESGQLLHRLTENLRSVNAIAFSPDGTILATGESADAARSTIKLWNPRTGEALGTLPEGTSAGGPNDVSRLAFSGGGSWLAAGSLTSPIRVWNYETRTLEWTIPNSGVLHLAMNSDGTLLAGLKSDMALCVWDLKEQKLLKSWAIDQTPTARTFGLFFGADGSSVLTAHGQNSIAIWSARTGERLSQIAGGLFGSSTRPAMSPDGRWLGLSNSTWITILDVKSGVTRAVLPGHTTTKLAFSPKGDRLFSGGGHPFVVRSDLNLPTLVGRGPMYEITAGHLRAFSRDKPVCLLEVGGRVVVWNYEKQSPTFALKTDPSLEIAKAIGTFSPGARRAAMLDDRNRLHIWDVATGDRLLKVQIPGERAFAPEINFSADGEVLWVVAARGLWKMDLSRKAPELSLDWPEGTDITSLSPDGRFVVASRNQRQMQAWQSDTREAIFRDDEYPYHFKRFAFTADSGKLLGLTDSNEYLLWDLERRELLKRFNLTNNQVLNSGRILFFPDHQTFLEIQTGGTHPHLRAVDTQSQQVLAALRLSPANRDLENELFSKTQLHITFDGRYAVTNGTRPGRVAFWNLQLYQLLGKPQVGSELGIEP